MERRTLVRLLIVLAIGIPLLVEVATFAGLFESRVLGDDPASPTETATATPTPAGVEVGEELLPTTSQRETLVEATIRSEDGERRLQLTVEVENDGSGQYALRLDALTTREGTTIADGGGSIELGPGEVGSFTAAWTLPGNERPAAVIAVASTTTPEGERETVTRSVPISEVNTPTT